MGSSGGWAESGVQAEGTAGAKTWGLEGIRGMERKPGTCKKERVRSPGCWSGLI
jgi:hypothetical protein